MLLIEYGGLRRLNLKCYKSHSAIGVEEIINFNLMTSNQYVKIECKIPSTKLKLMWRMCKECWTFTVEIMK